MISRRKIHSQGLGRKRSVSVPLYIIGSLLVVAVTLFLIYKLGLDYATAEKKADKSVTFALLIIIALFGGIWAFLSK
jgi:heme/copper-type cytochrome/quinol oxidase subunit 4